MTVPQFGSGELLRQALEELADAEIGGLALAAVERVAARSELLEVAEDEDAWRARLDDVRRRLA